MVYHRTEMTRPRLQENCPSCKNELTKLIMQGVTEDELVSRGSKCRKCSKLLSTVAATLAGRMKRTGGR